MSRDTDRKKLEEMKDGDEATCNWSEEGGGEVIKSNGMYAVFYIPAYGGDPQFDSICKTIEEVLTLTYSWT